VPHDLKAACADTTPTLGDVRAAVAIDGRAAYGWAGGQVISAEKAARVLDWRPQPVRSADSLIDNNLG